MTLHLARIMETESLLSGRAAAMLFRTTYGMDDSYDQRAIWSNRLALPLFF
jgi:hypothetical protein